MNPLRVLSGHIIALLSLSSITFVFSRSATNDDGGISGSSGMTNAELTEAERILFWDAETYQATRPPVDSNREPLSENDVPISGTSHDKTRNTSTTDYAVPILGNAGSSLTPTYIEKPSGDEDSDASTAVTDIGPFRKRDGRGASLVAEVEQVPGIHLGSRGSTACSDVSLKDTNNFHLCFFLLLSDKSANLESFNTIIELRDSERTLIINYGAGGVFLITYGGSTTGYPKLLEFEEWTKLCVEAVNGRITLFEVNSRITREDEKYSYEEVAADETEGDKNLEDEEIVEYETLAEEAENSKAATEESPTLRFKLCVGGLDTNKSSIIGAIAGITLSESGASSSVNDSCLIDHSTTYILLEAEVNQRDLQNKIYRLSELCWGTHVFFLIDGEANFMMHSSICKNYNSRLIQTHEATAFSKELTVIFSEESKYKHEEANIFNSHSWLQVKAEAPVEELCPAYDFIEGKVSFIHCKTKLKSNFCLLPKYAGFLYFGLSDDFDHFYTLQTRNNSIYLKGEEQSFLKKENDHWNLHSDFREKPLSLYNSSVPFGRHSWEDSAGEDGFVVTFTSCGEHHFACSNGQCVLGRGRCNEKADCEDNSDEEDCDIVQKEKHGSAKSVSPAFLSYPFVFEYIISILRISAIDPTDRIANISLEITLNWIDPRVIFKTNTRSQRINCSDIWVPSLKIEDSDKIALTTEIEKNFCSFSSLKSRTVVKNDPYMGHTLDGLDAEIDYNQHLAFAVPCNLNLNKYPFGIEICNFTIDMKTGFDYREWFAYNLQPHHRVMTTEKLYYYFHNLVLGEFYFLGATHSGNENNDTVTITIKLQTLYGYHVINSFTTSFLIGLTSYGTLFYPIDAFNERIMVSLTSQLVLAALLTQASYVSSRTGNINYLDIWYIALMLFGFLSVIANVLIHNINSRGQKMLDSKNGIGNFCFKHIKKLNRFYQIVFGLLMVGFITLFGLGAADIIF